ncbi:S1 RNA-binding domain-containing protein [Dactylosporangium sp. NPDC005555]|uniref:S1 RNA-binding domain-containing protein n=1 Tax=Dactylosporangium sp. NPDC005555 TaxID=3154889 RepID=UPI00339F4812
MSRFEDFRIGDVVDGEVTGEVPFGTFVRFADGVDGLLPGVSGLRLGATVTVRVLDKDAERRRASLELAE